MGIAPERTFVPSVASLRIQSRALRALPLTALVLDVLLLCATGALEYDMNQSLLEFKAPCHPMLPDSVMASYHMTWRVEFTRMY